MECIPFSVIHIDTGVEFVEQSVDKLAAVALCSLDKQHVDMCRRRRCFDSQVDSKWFDLADPVDRFVDSVGMIADLAGRFAGSADRLVGKTADTMVDIGLELGTGLEGADKLAVVVELGSLAECKLSVDVIVAVIVVVVAIAMNRLVENPSDRSDIVVLAALQPVVHQRAVHKFFVERMALEPIDLMTPVVGPAMKIAAHAFDRKIAHPLNLETIAMLKFSQVD